jgi:hypothetical protein
MDTAIVVARICDGFALSKFKTDAGTGTPRIPIPASRLIKGVKNPIRTRAPLVIMRTPAIHGRGIGCSRLIRQELP